MALCRENIWGRIQTILHTFTLHYIVYYLRMHGCEYCGFKFYGCGANSILFIVFLTKKYNNATTSTNKLKLLRIQIKTNSLLLLLFTQTN